MLALSGAEPIETLFLLVAERAVKLLERGLTVCTARNIASSRCSIACRRPTGASAR